jgi:hypothetical protein
MIPSIIIWRTLDDQMGLLGGYMSFLRGSMGLLGGFVDMPVVILVHRVLYWFPRLKYWIPCLLYCFPRWCNRVFAHNNAGCTGNSSRAVRAYLAYYGIFGLMGLVGLITSFCKLLGARPNLLLLNELTVR